MRWQGLGDCGATARARYQLKKMNDCIHFTYPHFTYHQLTSVMLIHNSIIGNCHFADSIFIDENMSTHKIGWMNFSVFTHPSAAALWCVHSVSSYRLALPLCWCRYQRAFKQFLYNFIFNSLMLFLPLQLLVPREACATRLPSRRKAPGREFNLISTTLTLTDKSWPN